MAPAGGPLASAPSVFRDRAFDVPAGAFDGCRGRFRACFESAETSINGAHPYVRVAAMGPGALIDAMRRHFSAADLVLSGLGLLPFAVAWRLSKTRQTRLFWFVSALVALVVIVAGVSVMSLADFHDCDRSGVSLGILLAPILYMAANLAAIGVLAILRYPFTL